MTDHLGRSFELLEILQGSPSNVSAADLAETLRVNTRSVRRLITELRNIGFGIESVPGLYGGYRLGPGRKVAPLLPTEAEVVTLPYACQVEAVFAAPAAEVASCFPIDAVFVEPIDEHSCRVYTGADTYETVAIYLLAANVPFTITSPDEMRTKMLETAQKLRQSAQRCSRPGFSPA